MAGEKVGRNDKCPCGSGRKFKKCCLGKAEKEKPKGAAHYRCRQCRHEWDEDPKMVKCPECGHIYVDWVNFGIREVNNG